MAATAQHTGGPGHSSENEERNKVRCKSSRKESTSIFEDSIILNRNPTNSLVRKFTKLNTTSVATKQKFLNSSASGSLGS